MKCVSLLWNMPCDTSVRTRENQFVSTLFLLSLTAKVGFYGGEPNYYMMEKCDGGQRARFVGEGETVRTFPLVIGSRFNVPLLIDLPGDGQKISGEIYAVNKEKLSVLDEFEGVPSYYVRRQEEILMRPKERIATDSEEQPCTYFCDMYFIQNHNPKLLRLPMIGRYSSFDSHGLRYIPRTVNGGREKTEDMIRWDSFPFVAVTLWRQRGRCLG
ncbi:gamma-glutamylaminecyclotransferase-like isoform X2 [Paramacrobiotus metropolitanus]|uniref:gamma-glutamylaminecyclotransferase-like isoform X2 n=1 Tax=Paramacrobiotus metropolitanus TaxID=2943436 RepID=UPI00244598BA|nr:gamma-glutamylaminecyclotransferase-like isoform X2 [Paramacrobiotus metropolitanus]